MIRWRLAMRLLVRNWHAGEQRVLVAALVIAVAASTAIGFFTDRLGRGLTNQSADFLGADLVLASPRPVETAWAVFADEDRLGEWLDGFDGTPWISGEANKVGGVHEFVLRDCESGEEMVAADLPEDPW